MIKVSVIGWGKMGEEITDVFLDTNIRVVWIGRDPKRVPEISKKIEKKIKKIARRNEWPKDKIEERQEEIHVSANLEDARDSQWVIETITENLEGKQGLFHRLQEIVSPECLLLTNTSSLPLRLIFDKVSNKERCLGLHFFYPCKLIHTVEINYLPETDRENIRHIEEVFDYLDREYVVLPEEINLLFSKLIYVLMSEAYNIYLEGRVDEEEINRLTRDDFLLMGIFDILNSTGNAIVYNCTMYFTDPENEDLYRNFKSMIHEIHEKYEDRSFSEYAGINTDLQRKGEPPADQQYSEEVITRLKSVYIGYLTQVVNAVSEDEINLQNVIEASRSILGVSQEPREMIQEIGEERIKEYYKEQDYRVWHQ